MSIRTCFKGTYPTCKSRTAFWRKNETNPQLHCCALPVTGAKKVSDRRAANLYSFQSFPIFLVNKSVSTCAGCPQYHLFQVDIDRVHGAGNRNHNHSTRCVPQSQLVISRIFGKVAQSSRGTDSNVSVCLW